MGNPIKYRSGYKYQLVQTHHEQLLIMIPETVAHGQYLKLETTGRLTIYAGYAFDGPSGPTFDTASFMRASLVHDALYQLMRNGKLDINHRLNADNIMRMICCEDGMSRFRAWYVYQAVRRFGAMAMKPKEIFLSPGGNDE